MRGGKLGRAGLSRGQSGLGCVLRGHLGGKNPPRIGLTVVPYWLS